MAEGEAVEPHRSSRRGRTFASVVLVLLGALLAPVGVVAGWAQRELTDTDRYVATIGPLARDPVVRSAVADRLTEVVMEQVGVSALFGDLVSTLGEQGLPPRLTSALAGLERPVVNGVRSFVHDGATRVVESGAFETAWSEANRVAHQQLLAAIRGDEAATLQIGAAGELSIQLAGLVERLKGQLVEAGFTLAANIPEVSATFTLVQTTQLIRVQNAYRQLVLLGTWLPWLSLALLVAAVVTATRRTRGLVAAGLALTASMLVLALGLALARTFYLDALTGAVDTPVAEAVFDQVVTTLRISLRTIGALGLVIALAAYVGGPGEAATGLRAGVGAGLARVRGWGDRRGVSTGSMGEGLYRYRAPVRVALLALASLVLLFSTAPTPSLVVSVAVVVVVLVALVELVSRPPKAM